MATPRLGFATQAKGTANWHTPLENGFQTAEDRLTLSGSGSPSGVVAGFFIGQRYWQTDTFSWWVSLTATGVAGTTQWLKEVATGTIRMFNSTTAPLGWAICDGSGGTPNLKGRFIVGRDAADADYDAVGDVGGAKTTTLAAANIPQMTTSDPGDHTHVIETHDEGDTGFVRHGGAGTGNPAATQAAGAHTHTVGTLTPTAIDRRPPFFTLVFIIKL